MIKAEGKSPAERTKGDEEDEPDCICASDGEASQRVDLKVRSVVVFVSRSSTERGIRSALRTRTVMERKSLRRVLRGE